MLVKKYEPKRKIRMTFLGTGFGVPTAQRYRTAILLEVDDRAYLLDAGAPVADILQRRNYDLPKIKALFNTHFHMDHIFGGIALMDLFSVFFKDTDMQVYLPSEEGKQAIYSLLAAGGNKATDRLKMSVYDDDFIYDDGYIRLVPIRNAHGGKGFNSFGFYIEIDEHRILFTGDMSNGLKDDGFPKIAFDGHFDVVISECTHFGVQLLAENIKKTDTDIFAVTHVYPLDKFVQLEELSDELDCTLLVAEDDDEIEF